MKFLQNTILFKMLQRIEKINPNEVFEIVFNDPRITNMIIDLNTNEQLFEQGVDSEGRDLKSIGGDYSYVTKDIKSFKNQPYDHITLKDTGDFYRSFIVRAYAGRIVITADTIKDDDDLTDRWGTDILGLTKESREKLVDFAKDFYVKQLKLRIWK